MPRVSSTGCFGQILANASLSCSNDAFTFLQLQGFGHVFLQAHESNQKSLPDLSGLDASKKNYNFVFRDLGAEVDWNSILRSKDNEIISL